MEYKFFVNGTTWETNATLPMTTDDAGDMNNLASPITCPNGYTCATPPVPPAGVFDWRDAVIYFVFVDRFLDGDSSNDCNVVGSQTTPYTSTNYLGGDWAGVTQKITAGYFNDLGVNTLWITVPIKNADDVADEAWSATAPARTTGTCTPRTTGTGRRTRRRPSRASGAPRTSRRWCRRRMRRASRCSSTTRWCTSTPRARSTSSTRTTARRGSPRTASAAPRGAATSTRAAGSRRTWRTTTTRTRRRGRSPSTRRSS